MKIILLLLVSVLTFADTPPIIYQFASPLVKTGGKNVSIPAATDTTSGYLTSTDHATFNNKFDLPSQTGNAGKVLSTNGTSTSWLAVGGTGTVTNVSSGDASLDITNPTTTPDIRVHWPMTAGVAGTAAAPAITWGGSGIFQFSYGLVNFSTLGTERLRINNDGSIVVGPGGSGTLTVNGAITSTGDIGAVNANFSGNISAANYPPPPPTGSANTFAIFDSGGALASSPHMQLNTFGGINTDFNENVNNTGGGQVHSWNQNFTPSVDSNDNWLVHNINTQIDMSGGHDWAPSANALTQVNQGIYITGQGGLGGLQFNSANIQVGDGTNPAAVGSVDFYNAFANVQNNAIVSNHMNGYGFSPTWQTGSAMGSGFFVNAFYDGSQFNNVPSYGHTSFGSAPNLFQVSNNYNYTAFIVNPNITTLQGNAGAYGYGFYPNITTEGATGNVVTLNSNPNITTMGASGAFNGVALGGHVVTSHGSISGYSWFPQIDGGDANLTGLNISPHGTAVLPQVQGENIDLSQIGIAPNQQKVGLSLNDGALNVGSNIDTAQFMPAGEWQHNLIGGTFHIASGSPITNGSFGFGNNMGPSIQFDDNMGPDFTSVGLGYSVNGLAGQLAGASGKTMDTLNYVLVGAGIAPASAGGTVSNLSFVKVLGLLPQGGSLNVTNLAAFHAGPILCLIPSNCWGVKVESTGADNWFAKDVVIGGSTGKPTSTNAVLEITDGHFKVSQTTPPTAVVNANAGTGATCTLASGATDSGGYITIAFGTGATNTGEQCAINFFKAYDVAPVCTFSAASSGAAADMGSIHQVYMTTTTTAASLNYGIAQNSLVTNTWSYNCHE